MIFGVECCLIPFLLPSARRWGISWPSIVASTSGQILLDMRELLTDYYGLQRVQVVLYGAELYDTANRDMSQKRSDRGIGQRATA